MIQSMQFNKNGSFKICSGSSLKTIAEGSQQEEVAWKKKLPNAIVERKLCTFFKIVSSIQSSSIELLCICQYYRAGLYKHLCSDIHLFVAFSIGIYWLDNFLSFYRFEYFKERLSNFEETSKFWKKSKSY